MLNTRIKFKFIKSITKSNFTIKAREEKQKLQTRKKRQPRIYINVLKKRDKNVQKKKKTHAETLLFTCVSEYKKTPAPLIWRKSEGPQNSFKISKFETRLL